MDVEVVANNDDSIIAVGVVETVREYRCKPCDSRYVSEAWGSTHVALVETHVLSPGKCTDG